MASEDFSSQIVFYLNKKEVVLKHVQPETTILQYLRSPGMFDYESDFFPLGGKLPLYSIESFRHIIKNILLTSMPFFMV